MNKWIKYAVLPATIVLVAYNSVYIRRLSHVQQEAAAGTFDAEAYADHFLHVILPAHPDKAIDLPLLSRTLSTDPSKAFSWSHAQNNGNNRFFLVKGTGRIVKIDSEQVSLAVEGVGQTVVLATRYIIGTGPRDASGLISVNEFTTTMDMNTVSERLNQLIRTIVLPPFRAASAPGREAAFTAALELQRDAAVPDTLELTPMILKMQ